jgi:hypothetical protein
MPTMPPGDEVFGPGGSLCMLLSHDRHENVGAEHISAVVVRDIPPALRHDRLRMRGATQLPAGHICTFVLLALIASYADHFSGAKK